jgi:hypothetical protein
MALMDFLKRQLIDIIERTDDSRDTCPIASLTMARRSGTARS